MCDRATNLELERGLVLAPTNGLLARPLHVQPQTCRYYDGDDDVAEEEDDHKIIEQTGAF